VINPSTGGNPDTTGYQYSLDGNTYFPITDLTNGTTFTASPILSSAATVYVQAISTGQWTSSAGTVAVSPLVAPLLANVTVGSTSVLLTVRPPTNPPTTYYYSVSGGIYDGTTFTAAAASPITVSGLTAGTNYRISLVANYSVGNTSATTFSVIPGGGSQPKYVALGYSPTYGAAAVKYSYDGTTIWSDGGITTSYPTSIFHNANIWVVGGNGASGKSSISYSSDGVSWLPATNANAVIAQVNGVYYSGNAWVAVGNGIGTGANVIATSPDAVTWTGRSNALLGGVGKSIVHRNGYWFAGGINGAIATATVDDGSAWTAGTVGINQSVNGFEWNGNAIVAVGQSTGTQIQYAYTAFLNPSALVWVNATVNGNVATSTNTLSSALTAVSYGKGQFVAVGKSTTTYPIVYTSLYGNNWTPVALPTTITPFLNAVNYYDSWGLWTVTGNVVAGKFAAATSPDGLTWTGSTALNSKLFEGDNLLAVSPLNKIRTIGIGRRTTPAEAFLISYSFNGLNWFVNTKHGVTSRVGRSMTHSGNLWLIGAQNSTTTVFYSANGLSFTGSPSATSVLGSANDVHCLAYGNGVFVAATTKAAYSTDGITWTASAATFSPTPSFLVYRNGMFVLGTYAPAKIYTSTDGNTWSAGASIGALVDAEVSGIEWDGTRWVIACNSSAAVGKTLVVYSSNLTSFTAGVRGSTTNVVSRTGLYADGVFRHALTYSRGMFLLCGNDITNTIMLTSTNGINWTYNTFFGNPLGSQNLCSNANDYGYTVGCNVTVANNAKYYPFMTSTNGNTWIVNTSFNGVNNDFIYAQRSTYVVPGSKPIITNMIGGSGSITVVFTPSTGGDSPVTNYQYALDSPTNFFNVTNLSNDGTSFPITGLTNPSYTVYLQAVGTGWTSAYDSSLGYLSVVGAAPVVFGVYSIVNGIKVFFNKPVGGYPDPDAYYYTLSGDVYDGTAYYLASTATSPITITGLTAPVTYTVGLVAHNTAGNTTASTFSKAPYLAPLTAPSITQIDSSLNKLIVSFTGPTDTYLPTNPVYYYSVDGGAFVNSTKTTSPLTISSGLTTAKSYTVAIRAVATDASGTIWTTATSADASGSPYIQGSDPTVQSLAANVSILNALDVTVSASTGGYPDPTNYLVATDAAFTNVLANLVAPATSTTLTGLLNQQYTVYAKAISGSAWSTGASAAVSATPFYQGTAAVAAAPVVGTLNALQLTFSTPVLGNPLANVFSYSLDNGSTYTSSAANTVVVTGLPSSSSTVYATVGNGSIWTSDSVSVTASPYYAPTTDPVITTVDSSFQKLVVNFTASTGSNPAVTKYFCAVDSTAPEDFIFSGLSSPIVITGLLTSTPRHVYLKSVGNLTGTATTIWTSATSSGFGQPYVAGSAPTIAALDASLNALLVTLTGSSGGNPDPTNYLLSYDAAFGTVQANVVAPLSGSILLSAPLNQSYTVYAKSIGGNIWTSPTSTAVSATPFYKGTVALSAAPVVGTLNALQLTFSTPVLGNPLANVYSYSLDNGSTYTSSAANVVVLEGLPSASSTVYATVGNGSIWTSDSVSVTASPYYAPTTDPSINAVVSGIQRLTVYVSASAADGNPSTSRYFCALNSTADASFVYSNVSSPIVITGVNTVGPHTVYLRSVGNLTGGSSQTTVWTSNTVSLAGVSPYVVYNAPVITSVSSAFNSLTVSFDLSGGNPGPTAFYYTVSGGDFNGSVFYRAAEAASPITVDAGGAGLSKAGTYTVTLKAENVAGNSLVSASATGSPFVLGQAPTITSVTSAVNSLRVEFQPPVGMNPAPTTYYYAVDSTAPTAFVDLQSTDLSFTVPNLLIAKNYSVYVKASNGLGNTAVSAAGQGKPYVIGSAPTITSALSKVNAVTLNFVAALDGYPAPDAYYYTVSGDVFDGTTFYLADLQDLSMTTFDVTGLQAAIPYDFQLVAHNVAGNTAVATASQIPYILSPTNPVIESLQPAILQLTVGFAGLTGSFYPTTVRYVVRAVNGTEVVTSDETVSATSPYDIQGITTNTPYTVTVRAHAYDGSTLVWTQVSDASSATPYVIGTAPTITAMTSALNQIRVGFAPSQGSYPPPTTYLYALDGASEYVDANTTSSPLVISGFTEVGTHTVRLKARSVQDGTTIWTSLASDASSGQPYIAGLAPVITELVPGLNTLQVNFILSLNDYPQETGYEYAVQTVPGPDPSYVSVPSWTGNTFTISDLSNSQYTVYLRAFSGNVWTSEADSRVGYPYLRGTDPSNVVVASELNQLRVSFEPSTGGQPVATEYQYAFQNVDACFNTVTQLVNGNTFSLAAPLNQVYTVYVRGRGLDQSTTPAVVAWTSNVALGSGRPFIVATTPPSIQSLTPGLNSLAVAFTAAAGGFPDSYSYQYSVDGGATYVDTTPVGSTITIGGLTEPRAYSVKLVAINTAGTSAPSSPTFSATPYVAPNVAATIVSVDSSYQALVVNFTGSSGSSPVNPTTYYYSLDNGATYVDASSTTSPLVITSGLTTVGERSVRIKSAFRENGSVVWYAPPSAAVPGSPYIAPGVAPTVTSVDSSLNRLLLRFGASSGSYPANPTDYLYSLDGAAYQSMNTADTTSTFVIGNVSAAGPHTVAVKSEYRLPSDGTLVWQSAPSTTFTGAYAYVAGSRPNIAAIAPGIRQLTVRFQPSAGGYPSTSKYQYAFANVDASFVDTPALVNGNTFVLADLSNQSYTVYLRALGPTSPSATWVSAVDSASSRPYVVGSVPTIRSIQSGTNSLTVAVQSSTGGYPAVAGYRYRYQAVSGNFQSANAFSAGNTFTLTGLSNEIYTVSVQAVGNVGSSSEEAWTTAFDASDGRPFVVGSAPVVQSIAAGVRSLEVTFTNSTGGYPTPTIYYSVSGGTFDPNTYVDSGLTTSPIVVPGLTQAGTYFIRLKAVNAGGNSAPSNALSGQPVIVVATMTVNGVASRPNGLEVSYLLDQDPNFTPSVYAYSVNSGSYVATADNTSPMAITGLNAVGTYTVQLRVSDAFGVNVFSNVARGQPYIAGAAPVLLRANSGPESLVIAYNSDAVGGYPSTTSYQYTFDGGNTYVDSSGSLSVTANPLVLPNLTENREYRVQLRSVNAGGVSPEWSNEVVGRPYVGGTEPTVLQATTDATAARLVIAPGTGAYPEIVAYEYSLDGGAYTDVAVSVDGVLRITNLDSDRSYVVRVRGRNIEGVRSAAALVTVKTDTPARFYGLVMTPVGPLKKPIFIGPQPRPSKLGTSTNNPTETSKMRWARRRAGGRLYR
jgi:hypothetical protein